MTKVEQIYAEQEKLMPTKGLIGVFISLPDTNYEPTTSMDTAT